MYPYLEKYANPRNEYKIYFTGKFEEPVEEQPPPPPPAEPVKPPAEPVKPPAEPVKPPAEEEPAVKASADDKLRLVINEWGRSSAYEVKLGEVVAMLHKDRIYLVTADESGNLLII